MSDIERKWTLLVANDRPVGWVTEEGDWLQWVGIYRAAETVRVVPIEHLWGAIGALDEAVEAARLFNRSGMTWQEYDRLLVRLEGVVNQARGR